MVNLYTQADSNIRKTWVLIFLMLFLIITLSWFFSYLLEEKLIFWIGITISLVMGVLSYWFSDKIIISMVRAELIEKKDNPELYRIVENLCLTAGLPLPKIYILNENQPNAFATGRNPQNSIIVVTRGLLEKLDRTELEGVIAHELSHIGNRDVLLASAIVILAGVISLLSDNFLRTNRWRRRDGDSKNNQGSVFLILGIIAALLAPLAASLIRLAISRKREFLADASGALLTRYPEGLASALEKISGDSASLKVANSATSHLYISSPFKGDQARSWFVKLFMTHPPIEERVKALRETKF